MTKEELKQWIGNPTYDFAYQSIEALDFIGYSQSEKTWERMKDLVDWKGKTVVELGQFHGFFGFKIEKLGGMVIGLEKYEVVIETVRRIAEMSNSKNIYQQWEGGDIIPQSDITLCLNMLHHCKDQEATLKQFVSPIAIFEQNMEQFPLIEKYYRPIKIVESHRPNRQIMLGVKI